MTEPWSTSCFEFSKETSATANFTIDNVTRAYNGLVPAFADAVPSNISDFQCRRLSLYSESSKCLPSQITETDFLNGVSVSVPHEPVIMHSAELALDCFSGTIRSGAGHSSDDTTSHRAVNA